MRSLLTVLLCFAIAACDPVDTVYDFLNALEGADGYGMLGTFSESLESLLQARFDDLRDLAMENPGTVGMLVGRILPGMSPQDLQGMSLGGFLSLLLLQMNPAGYNAFEITRERIEMRGASAEVVIGWDTGDSLVMGMVWEEGAWRINRLDLLEEMFCSR